MMVFAFDIKQIQTRYEHYFHDSHKLIIYRTSIALLLPKDDPNSHQNQQDDNVEPISLLLLDDNDEEHSTIGIIDAIEALIDIDDLEPTPIDPLGVLQVVESVPVTTSLCLHNELPYLTDILRSLLNKNKRDLSEEENVTNICKAEPPYKKQRKRPFQEQQKDGQQDQQQQQQQDRRIHCYQAKDWIERFQELILFQKQYGHCLVPHISATNPGLGQWVKRQRYQYKLKRDGRHSTLIDERELALERLGFAWDHRMAAWMEHWNQLCEYQKRNGHSNVTWSTNGDPEYRQLAIWVSSQRRQYRHHKRGDVSFLTPERIRKMESLGFVWNPRGLQLVP
jgi:hypothetical protein